MPSFGAISELPISTLPLAPLTQCIAVVAVLQAHHPSALALNQDTSQSAKALLSGDFFRPVFNPAQFQIDPVRPVYDTTRGTAIEEIQPPLFNPPWFAPLKFWWQPPDSSQATAKTLYGDLYRAAVPPLSYQVDALRPVADTSRGSPDTLIQAPPTFTLPPRLVDLIRALPETSQSSFAAAHQIPVPATGFVATQPYVWLPSDTPLGTSPLLLVPQPPVVPNPWFGPLRFWWSPDTTLGSPYALIEHFVTGTQIGLIIESRNIAVMIQPMQTFTELEP
jgi:hypothetical protein